MAENLFETQYDLTKKSKLQKFYDSYKIVIFSFIFVLVILYGSFGYYLKSKENKASYPSLPSIEECVSSYAKLYEKLIEKS